MTMTETPATEAPKKSRRKPAKKRARARVAAMPPAASGDYLGITPSDCPVACTAERCVISGVGICAHPYKGGLQARMQNPESLRRLGAAKRAIGKRKLELTDE